MNFINSKKQLINTLWLMGDNFCRLGFGFLINIFMAKELGPEKYGVFNYCLALIGVFTSVASLGMNGIVVRDLVNQPEKSNEIITSSFLNQIIGSILASILIFISVLYLRGKDFDIIYFILLLIPSIFFRATDTVKYWYESRVESKKIVFCQTIAFFVGSFVKLCALIFPISFFWISASVSIQSFVLAILLLLCFKRDFAQYKFIQLKENTTYLLKESWPLVFSGLALMLYMRIDQIMLGSILGDSTVGVYSAALKFIEVWYFLPAIICASFFPNIIKAKAISLQLYEDKLQKLYDLLVSIGVLISVFLFLFSEFIIDLFFGYAYAEAASVIKIYSWVNVFYFLSSSSGRWYINEGLQRQALLRNIFGLVLAVILNYILIPIYGVKGAAYGTLITYVFTAYLSDLLHPRTRGQFFKKTKSLIFTNFFKGAFLFLKGCRT